MTFNLQSNLSGPKRFRVDKCKRGNRGSFIGADAENQSGRQVGGAIEICQVSALSTGSSIETIGRQDRNRAEQEFENDNIYAFGVSEGLQNEIDEIVTPQGTDKVCKRVLKRLKCVHSRNDLLDDARVEQKWKSNELSGGSNKKKLEASHNHEESDYFGSNFVQKNIKTFSDEYDHEEDDINKKSTEYKTAARSSFTDRKPYESTHETHRGIECDRHASNKCNHESLINTPDEDDPTSRKRVPSKEAVDHVSSLSLSKVNKNKERIKSSEKKIRVSQSPALVVPGSSFVSTIKFDTPKLKEKSSGIPPSRFYSGSKSLNFSRKNEKRQVGNNQTSVLEKLKPAMEFFRPALRRSSRCATKLRSEVQATDEIITIESSEDDESEREVYEEKLVAQELAPVIKPRTAGASHVFEISRIAIGSQVFSSKCCLKILTGANGGTITSIFAHSSDSIEHVIKLNLRKDFDAIHQILFFLVEDNEESDQRKENNEEMTSFIAIRANPEKVDGLTGFIVNHYSAEFCSSLDSPEANSRQYMVLELRNDAEFKSKLYTLRADNSSLSRHLSDNSKITSWQTAKKYCYFLIEDTKRMEKERSAIIPSRAPCNKEQEDGILLVYPFVGGLDIELAAASLTEASEVLAPGGIDSSHIKKLQHEAAVGRSHYLSINTGDRDRLLPKEYLNDTVVDFWMRWIWRHESPIKSRVHFFTSHFYTTIIEDSPEAVTSWTKKKKIDVFNKELIFLPINAMLHWSLCVVVNPGSIEMGQANNPPTPRSRKAKLRIGDEEDDGEIISIIASEKMPCILFFDSLKAHKKKTVTGHVRKWLNSEWNMKHESTISAPFNSQSCPVYTPAVPYQHNSWDCGVYVCKYAYALYKSNKTPITYADVLTEPPFRQRITDNTEFKFDFKDIERLRAEIGTLIDNLAAVFLSAKNQRTTVSGQSRSKIETGNINFCSDKQPRSEESFGDDNDNTHSLKLSNNAFRSPSNSHVVGQEAKSSSTKDLSNQMHANLSCPISERLDLESSENALESEDLHAFSSYEDVSKRTDAEDFSPRHYAAIHLTYENPH